MSRCLYCNKKLGESRRQKEYCDIDCFKAFHKKERMERIKEKLGKTNCEVDGCSEYAIAIINTRHFCEKHIAPKPKDRRLGNNLLVK